MRRYTLFGAKPTPEVAAAAAQNARIAAYYRAEAFTAAVGAVAAFATGGVAPVMTSMALGITKDAASAGTAVAAAVAAMTFRHIGLDGTHAELLPLLANRKGRTGDAGTATPSAGKA